MGHLRAAGFPVKKDDGATDLAAVKRRYRIPPDLQSCHTAIVDGYVVEGHVPADLISRLLADRPRVLGLAVPGMPVGSPGMEAPGQPAARYNVIAFDADGTRRVFATR